MKITLISSEHDFFDYNISDAGSIYRACVSATIKVGDIFNIYHGDGKKSGVIWKGSLEKSIELSEVYKGVTKNSESFYDHFSEIYNKCGCEDPSVKKGSSKIIAVDLESPEYERDSSRWIVWLGACNCCGKDLTHGANFGYYSITGVTEIKEAAKNAARELINWSKVLTSRSSS